jgi:hypothetical protein
LQLLKIMNMAFTGNDFFFLIINSWQGEFLSLTNGKCQQDITNNRR